jgi:hypothetical protein
MMIAGSCALIALLAVVYAAGAGGRVGRRKRCGQGVADVLERGPELLARAVAEVVVEEVRRVRIVSAPADEAQDP